MITSSKRTWRKAAPPLPRKSPRTNVAASSSCTGLAGHCSRRDWALQGHSPGGLGRGGGQGARWLDFASGGGEIAREEHEIPRAATVVEARKILEKHASTVGPKPLLRGETLMQIREMKPAERRHTPLLARLAVAANLLRRRIVLSRGRLSMKIAAVSRSLNAAVLPPRRTLAHSGTTRSVPSWFFPS